MQINRKTDPFDQYLLKPRGDKLIRIHLSRNTLIAVIFSILIHALILSIVVPKIQLDTAAAKPPTSFEVSLAPPKLPEEIVAPVEQPVQPKEIPPPKIIKKPPKKIITKKAVTTEKPVLTVPEEWAAPIPVPKVEEKPVVEAPSTEAPTDMASYVRQQQAKRNALEADAARQNAEAIAREQGPSAEQLRDERIKNNFKSGTNGIFEITSLSSRRATFSFKGWTNDYSNARRQFFEVEASGGQDVRLVMVKKMIALIREHYQGDFNWDSQRLGRTIVKSARLEDNAELEEFLMMEFFGTRYKTQF
ncbi:MAG TPA: hypothetical protein PL133_01085 [Methylophilaceae bacterium]|nr:hypothetical protein [Methylophilaceae bacterium]HQC27961.1 hypothetical protein [Methylotenera sp.]